MAAEQKKQQEDRAAMTAVRAHDFYGEYHGHIVEHLRPLLQTMRMDPKKRIIWTAGDSSLDNKYWFKAQADAVGSHRLVLRPPVSKQDVTYWLNAEASARGLPHLEAINTAVEATTLNQRSRFGCPNLLPQDNFIRENIGPDDVLVISIGGNDIAMAPAPCTILNMVCLICCTP